MALTAGGCTSEEAPPTAAPTQAATPTQAAPEVPDDVDPPGDGPAACLRDDLALDTTDAVDDDPVEVAARLAIGTRACATEVLVVPADDPALAAIATPVALAASLPLLLATEDADVLPTDLTTPAGEAPVTVTLHDLLDDPDDRVGDASDNHRPMVDAPPPGRDDDADDDAAPGDDAPADPTVTTALAVADHLDVTTLVVAAADRPRDLAAAALVAGREGAAVLPLPDGVDLPPEVTDHDLVTVGPVRHRVPDAVDAEDVWSTDGDGDVVWLVDPDDAAGSVTVLAALVRGEVAVPVDGDDLRAGRRDTRRVRAATTGADAVVLAGTITADLDRQLPLLLEAPEVPGGGLTYFDGTRMVALYGKPGVTALGALGEQDLDATIERAREVSEGYDADGRDVVPALEVIVTVASRDAQDDGSYSAVTPPDEFRELVDRAAEEGFQVILDLQPGRTDFLTQAERYEDLLREPHVGLALDPEWRLRDDEVHLQQIGSVPAEEVQEVVDWLAELTRDAGLSQTLLVLHQFRLSMLPERDTIEVPDEIAAVVHADGQGPQATKDETWRVLTADGADRWHWGWKNFYDEDPVVAGPEKILDLDPEVVLVTYQ